MPPKIASLDFETELTDGTPSTEFYRADFRAKSVAIHALSGAQFCAVGESSIRALLHRLTRENYAFVCHNLQFEWGVVHERFPELSGRLSWAADTQRLVQLGDNGANEGVGLEKCAKRWLPTQYHNHKATYHALIEERGGKGGADLNLLNPVELQQYNLLDAEVTLELYKTLTAYFKEISFDWKLDWVLYSSTCALTAKSKIKGVCVDRSQVESSRCAISSERAGNEAAFLAQHATGIEAVVAGLKEKALAKYKTPRGVASADPSQWEFNIDSSAHLELLFVGYYGIKPQFFTPTGKASMSAKFFSQWEGHAALLVKRGNQEITLNQLAALEEGSRYDSRVHFDIRINGTKTGRGASGEV